MKAVAVKPGKKDSVHLVEMDEPNLSSIPNGRGVKVKVLRVGGCGTDREINNAEYGTAPENSDFLVLGHENLGQVVETGENVTEFAPGDYVVASVRRPGHSIYDLIGEQDMTTDTEYFERGISRLHGYFAEFYVESADFLVKLPPTLKDVGVLLEPLSIVEKGLQQAYEIQERAKIWRAKRAAVIGTGSVGLLTVMALRMRGLKFTLSVKTLARVIKMRIYARKSARNIIRRWRRPFPKSANWWAVLTLFSKPRDFRRLSGTPHARWRKTAF